MVVFDCPHCGKRLSVPLALAGKSDHNVRLVDLESRKERAIFRGSATEPALTAAAGTPSYK